MLALVRELGPTIMRYPGGNFVSGYNWEDGVGPPSERPTRLDLAWFSTEPNTFGTNEFVDWCRAAQVEPMLAVNLGTRERRCRTQPGRVLQPSPGSHYWTICGVTHGYEKPHDVKFWCLGNEMDGPWQMGHKTAAEYGRVAEEAAKMMRWIDPNHRAGRLRLVRAQDADLRTWEDEVLDHCFEHVDYISLHTYLNNYAKDTPALLASPDVMDDFIEEVVASPTALRPDAAQQAHHALLR